MKKSEPQTTKNFRTRSRRPRSDKSDGSLHSTLEPSSGAEKGEDGQADETSGNTDGGESGEN